MNSLNGSMSNKEVLGMQEGIPFRRWTGMIMVPIHYTFHVYTQRQPGLKMQIK